jgi:signal transduction histidine kinase
MWHSLRLRLLLAILLVVLVAVGVTAFVAGRRTAGEFRRYVEHRNPVGDKRLAYLLARTYATAGNWDGVQAEVAEMSRMSGAHVVVADAEGNIVADSTDRMTGEKVNPRWPPPVAAISNGDALVGALYLDPVDGRPDPDQAFVAALNRSLVLGALVAGLAAVAVTLAVSNRIVEPVERLTDAARRMEKGDLAVQVKIDSEDEIGQLARAFNAMAGSLAQQEELRRNMVGDVAHELRTPLTNLRGYLEAARDGLVAPDAMLLDNLYEETMLLQRLVIDLQDLAQAEAGQLTLVRQPTELGGIVEQAITMLRPQAEARSVGLNTDLPDNLPLVDVDPERVGQILRNLLNNAVAHTPEGGQVTVTASSAGPQVRVTVRDTGSGIAPEHLPYVFDRFYRADRSRSRQTGGAGLGLAIVKQLVAAHGGEVFVESAPGQGTAFSFTLPVALKTGPVA